MPVEPRVHWPRGRPRVRRNESRADLVRRRQDRLPHAAHVVPDVSQVPVDPAFRRVLLDRSGGRGRTMPGRDGHRHAQWADEPVPGRGGDHRDRRRGTRFPVHHQRRDQDRRRHGDGLPGGGAAEGHGVHPISPDRPSRNRHPDHRRRPRRGRHPFEQGRLSLPPGLRPRSARPVAAQERHGARAPRPPQPGILARTQQGPDHRVPPRRRGSS